MAQQTMIDVERIAADFPDNQEFAQRAEVVNTIYDHLSRYSQRLFSKAAGGDRLYLIETDDEYQAYQDRQKQFAERLEALATWADDAFGD